MTVVDVADLLAVADRPISSRKSPISDDSFKSFFGDFGNLRSRERSDRIGGNRRPIVLKSLE